MNAVLTDFGAQYTTSNDNFFLGDLRAGTTSIPGFAATSTSDFALSQVIVYNSALTELQIAEINEFMLTSVPEPGSMIHLGLSSLGLLHRRH
jgi:hypothetical protein